MIIRKIALFFKIPTTRHAPKIRKPLVVFRTHRKAKSYTETLPPVTRARKLFGSIWKVECVDNCTYFVLVEC